ncbi:hypothetical protein HK104_007917 [Borealophlyctis nickersoniae]|nr:hypothetical protein HK104_007917 [Borealophlyctis nickersoniae]
MLSDQTAADKNSAKASAALKKVSKALTDGGVVPDILPDGFEPSLELTVKFPSGKKVTVGKEQTRTTTKSHLHKHKPTQNIQPANFPVRTQLPLLSVISAPTITYTPPTPDTVYTLTMIDPDAPSRSDPNLGEWRHWVIANIPGADINKGEVLSEWDAPAPPQGTGLHRYVFVLYEQQGGRLELSVFEGKKSGWISHEWAKGLGMVPVAATFFQAQEK